MSECVYWNCGAGLVKKLSVVIDLLKGKTQASFVSECDIVKNKCLNVFSQKNFGLALANTVESHGKARIMCWFKNDVFERVSHLELPGNDIIVLRSLERNFLLVGCYRPFKLFPGETHKLNFDRLMANLKLITQTKLEVVLVGDLNINLLSNNVSYFRATLEAWADDNMLFQLVDTQTRQRMVAENLQTSLLDVVFTSMQCINVRLAFSHLSDHLQIFVSLPCTPQPHGKETIEFLDWTQYSAHAIRQLFSFHFRGINIYLKDTNLINNRITTAICQSLNVLLPKQRVTLRNSSQVLSPKIITLRNKKSKAFKMWTRIKTPDALAALKNASSALAKEVKKQKNVFIQSSLCKDTKTFWSTMNKFMGKNTTPSQDSFISGTNEIVDPVAIANLFCDHFNSKVMDLYITSACDNYVIPDLQSNFERDSFISESELVEAFKHLKPSKAQGFDELPSKVIKHLAPEIFQATLWLFNNVIESGKIPNAWKVSRIVPIHKKGDKKIVCNYRPISNISGLSKIFERCIIEKLRKIDPDVLFGPNQHAYKPGSSTTTACLTIQDYIASSLDNGRAVLFYSIDLTSAFDLIRPSILVKIMLDIGIDKNLIRVVLNFLTDRTGFVDFKGSNSNITKIPISCVQGSVLGPVLFNIYVNKLQTIVGKDTFCVSYADDSYVALSCLPNDTNTTINTLTEISHKHLDWLQSLGMICNASKSDFVAFGHHGPPLSMEIGGALIVSKSQIKILGVMFTSNLKWNTHANLIISKCNRMSYMLRYLRTFLNDVQHRRIIFSHFLSVVF